jgi:ceramide glucosyltransferase
VATDVIEPTFTTLLLREMRWLRTIRSVNPSGFASLIITFTSPWLVVGALLAAGLNGGFIGGGGANPLMALTLSISTAIGLIARILLHGRSARISRTFWRDLPLVPLRDTLLALQWLGAAFGTHVVWRGARMSVVNRVASPRTSIVEMSDRG